MIKFDVEENISILNTSSLISAFVSFENSMFYNK